MTSNVFEEMDYREGFAGGCYLNGTAICVAKPENYCDDETFVPAHYLRSNSGHPLRYCAGRLEDVIIGRCGGINGKCSNLQSRCNSDNNSSNGNNEGIIGNNSTSTEEEEDQNSSSFIEYDPTCTITQDLSSTSSSLTSLSYVTYGKCGDRCVWSSDDCINDEIYIPNGNNTECTADKVQIGACFGGHAFCAVDSSSCTQPNRPDEPYWTHQEVQEKIGANCFLSSLPVPTPAPVVSAPAPAQSPSTVTNTTTTTTNTAFGGEENLLSSSGNNNNNDGLNTGALVAIVTVIAIVVGIAIGVIGTVRFSSKRKNSNNSNNNTEQPPPTIPIEDIEIMSSPNNHNNNNNTMDDVDAHSELSEDNNDIIIN